MLFNFIWNYKPDKIKRSSLTAPIDKGGADMINVAVQNKALKITWVKRLLDDSNAYWKILVHNQLPETGEYLWNCNFCKEDVKYAFPNLHNQFWRDVLISWAEYNYFTPTNRTEILNQHIWFNSFIKINNEVLFYKNWFHRGITKVCDLFKKDGSFLNWEELVVGLN